MATATTQSGTQAPGGPKAPFPPFDREHFGSQIVWFAIAFAALYILLARLALPRLAAIFEARRNRLAGDLEAAGKLKAESEAAHAAYEKELAEARAKAQAIAAEAHQRLLTAAEGNKKRLETELAAKLAEAERKIAATKNAAMTHVRGIAVETAGSIVQILVGEIPNQQSVERAVDAVLH